MSGVFRLLAHAVVGACLWTMGSLVALAETTNLAELASRTFGAARATFLKQTNDHQAAWHFARAAFDWAEFSTNNGQRAEIATEAIAICRAVKATSPSLVGIRYYLGMNLGQLARTKTLGALRIVTEMEREFKAALGLDPAFDFAGPDRNLGLLYLEAPGWPASIGSKSKARVHLVRARDLAPDHPENRLNLIEAYLRWSESDAARKEHAELKTILPKARERLSGVNWAGSWLDWDRRLAKVEARLKN